MWRGVCCGRMKRCVCEREGHSNHNHKLSRMLSGLPPALTRQVPPLWHGFGLQSLMLVWQLVPEYPVTHVHLYPPEPSLVQVAPFWQGLRR